MNAGNQGGNAGNVGGNVENDGNARNQDGNVGNHGGSAGNQGGIAGNQGENAENQDGKTIVRVGKYFVMAYSRKLIFNCYKSIGEVIRKNQSTQNAVLRKSNFIVLSVYLINSSYYY